MGQATEIVRRVDEMGRVVLPREHRNLLGIEDFTALSIHVEGDRLIIQLAEPQCFLCGNSVEFITYLGKNLCDNCVRAIKEL